MRACTNHCSQRFVGQRHQHGIAADTAAHVGALLSRPDVRAPSTTGSFTTATATSSARVGGVERTVCACACVFKLRRRRSEDMPPVTEIDPHLFACPVHAPRVLVEIRDMTTRGIARLVSSWCHVRIRVLGCSLPAPRMTTTPSSPPALTTNTPGWCRRRCPPLGIDLRCRFLELVTPPQMCVRVCRERRRASACSPPPSPYGTPQHAHCRLRVARVAHCRLARLRRLRGPDPRLPDKPAHHRRPRPSFARAL